MTIKKIHQYTGHEGPVYALEQASDENKFFSGSGDKIVAEWNLQNGEKAKALVNVGAIIYAIKYIREKNWLLIGTSVGRIHVVDLATRNEIRNIAHHPSQIFDIQYSLLNQ